MNSLLFIPQKNRCSNVAVAMSCSITMKNARSIVGLRTKGIAKYWQQGRQQRNSQKDERYFFKGIRTLGRERESKEDTNKGTL